MAHVFDTGLALAQRTSLLTGAVALLAPLRRPDGYLGAVEEWDGDITPAGDGIEQLFSMLRGRTPAIVFVLGDETYEAKGMGGFAFAATVQLIAYHVTSHLRSQTQGRVTIDAAGLANNRANPGLHTMLEHAEELLVGRYAETVGKTIKAVRPRSVQRLLSHEGLTVVAQTFTVQLDRVINANRGYDVMIEEFQTRVRTSDMPDDPGDPDVAGADTPANAPP